MNYISVYTPTFIEKLLNKMLPYNPCDWADLPIQKDGIVIINKIEISFIDRIKILFFGKIEFQINVSTENVVGNHKVSTGLTIGRWIHK